MQKNKRFYNFVNQNESTELYLYGAIVSDKWCEDEVSFTDFRDAIESMNQNGVLNIYINSPGGEVFVTDAIVSMLTRAKESKNITINAYIDGLGASCASWLPMVADKIYIYDQSILMLHKPMTCMWSANANDMSKEIDLLNKIEDSMVKMYLNKAKEGVTEDKIKDMLAQETWLSATEIQEYFDVELISSEKKLVACVDKDLFKNYKNIPESLKNMVSDKKIEENPISEPVIDEKDKIIEDLNGEITSLKESIDTLTAEKEELSNKLNTSNDKVISLSEKVDELQPIVDEFNERVAKEKEEERNDKLQKKKDYYRNKFNKLGAIAKYESDDVQALLDICLDDSNAIKELNNMIVDLINPDDVPVIGIEMGTEFDNLIPEADGAEKYGFK